MNFHSLRYVSERCELGEKKEAILAVTIPEEKGSFKRFCQTLGNRVITEFNYRYAGEPSANVFVGVRLGGSIEERHQLLSELASANYQANDFTDNELAKLHIRYMIGGKNRVDVKNERLFSFEFPEHPGALEKFLDTIGELFNITLFHYRNHGAAFGQVLAGFEVDSNKESELFEHFNALGYQVQEVTDNQAYKAFLN
jgi:threonine dehydratase